MLSITIPYLEDELKRRLREEAAEHGRTIEDEAVAILRASLMTNRHAHQQAGPEFNLALSIRDRFALLGGVELAESPRGPVREPPDFGQ